MFSYFIFMSLYFVLLLLLHYLFANYFVFFFVTSPASKFEQKVKRPLKVILYSHICLFFLLLAVDPFIITLLKQHSKMLLVSLKHEPSGIGLLHVNLMEFKEMAYALPCFSVRIQNAFFL